MISVAFERWLTIDYNPQKFIKFTYNRSRVTQSASRERSSHLGVVVFDPTLRHPI